jgi:anaerobic dimethyl sulfoxide reductase subunit A
MIEIPITCNKDCGGGCPLLAQAENGRIVKIGNNPLAGPYMNGCVRGFQAARTLDAPDRLKKPLLRSGPRGSGQFREATWAEALDLIAARLGEIRDQSGGEAVLPLGGSGSCRGALHNTSRLIARFFNLYGDYTVTTGGYSSAAAGFVTPFILGTQQAGIDPATLEHSKLIILWGANPSDNRLGCETESAILAAKKRGVEVIVFDPRRTNTVNHLATQWIPVQPGTDSALMMAVLYVLLEEKLADRAFAESHSIGFEALCRQVLGEEGGEARTPEWAEKICGTPAETIRRFAREYGRAKPAALIPGLSIQRTIGGEEAIRMAVALQVATGNFGKLGGSSGALAWGRLPAPKCGALIAQIRKKHPAIPVYRWPDAVLEGKAGGYPTDIRAIYSIGGDYLVQGSDIRKNIRAFERVEFSVCHDYFLTPTARYCDVVLPVTYSLERQDIVFTGGNFLLFTNRAATPPPEVRNDYDILCDLAERLGFGDEFSEDKDEEAWLRQFVAASEVPDFDEFRRTGIYIGRDQYRVGLADFAADPQAHPLQTPSGKIEIASEAYARIGGSLLPAANVLPLDDHYPLRMVTPKSRYRIHSQNANIPWFRQQEQQALWIHPHDAANRGIADGQLVEVSSPQGRVRIAAHVTEEMMPGVVCLLEGVWPTFAADGADTAGSPNVLTNTIPTEPSKGSRTHSVLVQVAAA